MKKLIKTVILTFMWPFIWLQVGFSLKKDCTEEVCGACGLYIRGLGNCCTRALSMVKWWRA